MCVKSSLTSVECRIPAHSDDTPSVNITFKNTHPDIIWRGYEEGFNCTMPHYWHVQQSGCWYASLKHFTAVVELLVLHFTLVILALCPCVLVFREDGLLGNAWQAIAEVFSNDTAAAVQHGTMATDGDVEESFKSSGFHGKCCD
jgi:hypothetical protein